MLIWVNINIFFAFPKVKMFYVKQLLFICKIIFLVHYLTYRLPR